MLSNQSSYTNVPELQDDPQASMLLHNSYRRVLQGFSFTYYQNDEPKCVSVHRGFLTNGRSLPWVVRKLMAHWLGLTHPVVVLHDWLSEYLLIEAKLKFRRIEFGEIPEVIGRALELSTLEKDKQVALVALLHCFAKIKRNTKTLDPYKRFLEDHFSIRHD